MAQKVISKHRELNGDRPTNTYTNWDDERELKERARRPIREHNLAMEEMKPLLEIIAPGSNGRAASGQSRPGGARDPIARALK